MATESMIGDVGEQSLCGAREARDTRLGQLGGLVSIVVRSRRKRRQAWTIGLCTIATLLAAMLAAEARAQVLEIDDQGQVRRFDGPALFLGDGGEPRPITPTAKPGVLDRGAPKAHSSQVIPLLEDSARRAALSPELLTSVARRESGLNPSARSPKGAVGVMQLMPATARDLAVDPTDPAANIDGGARHLKALLARYDGDIIKALAAYNAGSGAVDRHGGPPPFRETQAYIDAILERMADAVSPRRKP